MGNADYSAREVLSKEAQVLFDDIVEQRVLGASSHIRMICAMIKDICNRASMKGSHAVDTADDIHRIADFFIRTRGEASQAISNAIFLIIKDIDDYKKQELNSLIEYINSNIELFEQMNKRNLDRINDYALSLLDGMHAVMLFDYSSTVGRLIESSALKGKALEIYIPESRALNGGKPYIDKCLYKEHKIHFIPDIAIYYYLKKCDGVFIGSETYYADGRVFNTVGSEMTACLCKQFNIPFYVLTTLIKIDIRSLYGYIRPSVMLDLKERMAAGFEQDLKTRIDFSCPELVEIPAEYITALVTEEGILSPTAVFHLSREYAKNIGR
jgi:ribose 1,5-bisphosphate isomerase